MSNERWPYSLRSKRWSRFGAVSSRIVTAIKSLVSAIVRVAQNVLVRLKHVKSEHVFRVVAMRAYRRADACGAASLQMRAEVVAEILHRRDDRMHSVDAEAAQRSIGHIMRELVEQRQVVLRPQRADDA